MRSLLPAILIVPMQTLPVRCGKTEAPAARKQIEARVEAARHDPMTEVLDGREVTWMAPERAEPKGVLVFFHGAGGEGQTWFSHPEGRRVVDLALDRGYLVVAPSSLDRDKNIWDLTYPGDNVDLPAIDLALDTLVDLEIVPEGVPHFGIGMSNGGAFVSLAGAMLEFDAISIYCASGKEKVFQDARRQPTQFVYSPTDHRIDPREVERNARLLEGVGVQVETHQIRPDVLSVARLARVQGLDRDTAPEVLAGMQDVGLVNKDRKVVVDPHGSEFRKILRGVTLPDGVDPEHVKLAARGAWGGHTFTSEFRKETLDFFDGIAARERNGTARGSGGVSR